LVKISENTVSAAQNAPAEEQSICVTCGMCCDGTLFLYAHLNEGERGTLPLKIEENSYSKDGKDYFSLPCHYFKSKCTIYNTRRAYVCGSYRCQLLKDFAGQKINLDDALATVDRAMNMRSAILEEYRKLTGNEVNFKQLLRGMGKRQKSVSDENPLGPEYDLLLARCNIFEALLIRHFRSASDFDKMMTPEEGKRQSPPSTG
jgi:hypothetical protein